MSEDLNNIVKRLIKDDKKALDEIYNLFYPRLYIFSKSFLKIDDDINDILQDVFVKIWMCRKNINNLETFNAYIFTITKNAIVSYFREKIKSQDFANRVKNQAVNEIAYSESSYEYEEMREKASLIIEQLPDKRKQAYMLCREAGLSHKEVAEKMGISVKTVEDHIMHANKFIHRHLKKMDILTLLYFTLFYNYF